MANNQVNLGKIDYDQIKTSLTEFLKNQDILKDYNFNGSVLQTVISLLSYNTFYYALYSNMLANEMFIDTAQREQSMVSLLKPLGILVPTKTSSRVKINIGGTSLVNKFDQFFGRTDDGIVYNFYALQEYSSVDGSDYIENVTLVEGKELVQNKDITTLFDYDTQSYFLGDIEADVSTIIVEVDEGDGVYKEWIRTDNIGDSTESLAQNIYFIERFDTGFELQFGKEKALGNEILDTYKTRISYLVSSGSAANNIVVFTKAVVGAGQNITIIVPNGTASSGGLDTPDLDYYRFIAPKFFAAQNRAVTKNDFLAISTEYLKQKGYNVTKNNFNVYGGDELYPPKYGRVFIATDAIQTSDILDLVAYLRTKCALTILPEYVPSNSESIFYDVKIVFANNNLSSYAKTTLLTNIKNYLTQNHSISGSYNINFSGVENDILQKYPEVSSCTLTLKYTKTYSQIPETGIIVNLENELNIPENTDVSICNPYLSNNGLNNIILKAYAASSSQRNELIDLRTYLKPVNSTQGFVYYPQTVYGSINISKGYIKVTETTTNPITITVELKNSSFISGTNTRFSILPNSVTEL